MDLLLLEFAHGTGVGPRVHLMLLTPLLYLGVLACLHDPLESVDLFIRHLHVLVRLNYLIYEI